MTAIARLIAAETAAPFGRRLPLAARFGSRARRARQAERLRSMPDHLLDDLGITREQAEAAEFLD